MKGIKKLVRVLSWADDAQRRAELRHIAETKSNHIDVRLAAAQVLWREEHPEVKTITPARYNWETKKIEVPKTN